MGVIARNTEYSALIAEQFVDVIKDYQELNSEVVDELYEEPSPLKFMRYVAQNRPFIVRKAATNWAACKSWTADHFTNRMGNCPIKVAVTPNGYAGNQNLIKKMS